MRRLSKPDRRSSEFSIRQVLQMISDLELFLKDDVAAGPEDGPGELDVKELELLAAAGGRAGVLDFMDQARLK